MPSDIDDLDISQMLLGIGYFCKPLVLQKKANDAFPDMEYNGQTLSSQVVRFPFSFNTNGRSLGHQKLSSLMKRV